MANDRDGYEKACDEIIRFTTGNHITWDWYERLGEIAPQLLGLNRFKWKQSVEGKSAKQPKLLRRTVELAEWIRESPQQVLDGMKVPVHLRRPTPKSAAPAAIQINQRRFFGSDPLADIPVYLGMAQKGHHEEAFGAMMRSFEDFPGKKLDQAVCLIPHALYIAYRYLRPNHWTPKFKKSVLDVLGRNQPRIDPVTRALCRSQAACAFNEAGLGKEAAELFFRPDVRQIWEFERDFPWYAPQVTRNVAMYWALHGNRPSEAKKWVEEARQFKPAQEKQAAKQMMCRALMAEDFGKAWEEIIPLYKPAREILLNAADNRGIETDDLLRCYTPLLDGVISRHLSGESYERAERMEDDRLLSWCSNRFGAIQMMTPTTIELTNRLPGEMTALQKIIRPLPRHSAMKEMIDLLLAYCEKH